MNQNESKKVVMLQQVAIRSFVANLLDSNVLGTPGMASCQWHRQLQRTVMQPRVQVFSLAGHEMVGTSNTFDTLTAGKGLVFLQRIRHFRLGLLQTWNHKIQLSKPHDSLSTLSNLEL